MKSRMTLPLAFWGFGVLGTPLVTIGVFRLMGLVSLPAAKMIIPIVVVALWSLLAFGLVCYASLSYRGSSILKWMARGVAGVGCAFVLGTIGVVYYVLRPDFTRTSLNAEAQIERDAAYPRAGFWKSNCSDDFGVVIEKSELPEHYYMSFCGPGGCMGKGPLSRIKFDSALVKQFLTVIDEQTLGLKVDDIRTQRMGPEEQAMVAERLKDGMILFTKCS